MVELPLLAVAAVFLVLGHAAGSELLDLLDSLAGGVSLGWTAALMYCAARISLARVASIGCAVALLVVILVVLLAGLAVVIGVPADSTLT